MDVNANIDVDEAVGFEINVDNEECYFIFKYNKEG